ncbi:MAG: hypothetical protein ACJ75B_12515 [Flavisolibacter sp.]
MITIEKLKIFEKYRRQVDEFARFGKSKEKSLMTDQDWDEIESLIQDVYLVKKGMAALEFENKLNQRLADICENQETIKRIHKIAEADIPH